MIVSKPLKILAGTNEDNLDGGTIVAWTQIMMHFEEQQFELSFHPEDGKHYYLWHVSCDSNGSNEAQISNVRLCVTVLGDKDSLLACTHQQVWGGFNEAVDLSIFINLFNHSVTGQKNQVFTD